MLLEIFYDQKCRKSFKAFPKHIHISLDHLSNWVIRNVTVVDSEKYKAEISELINSRTWHSNLCFLRKSYWWCSCLLISLGTPIPFTGNSKISDCRFQASLEFQLQISHCLEYVFSLDVHIELQMNYLQLNYLLFLFWFSLCHYS